MKDYSEISQMAEHMMNGLALLSTSSQIMAKAVVEMHSELLLSRRLLAFIRLGKCHCDDLTCKSCIAVYIGSGDIACADIALRRIEAAK